MAAESKPHSKPPRFAVQQATATGWKDIAYADTFAQAMSISLRGHRIVDALWSGSYYHTPSGSFVFRADDNV